MRFLDGIKNWIRQERDFDDFYEDEAAKRDPALWASRPVNITAVTRTAMFIVRARRFEDAAAIGDELREKNTVIINLEEADTPMARRILDFLAGVAYATGGQISKIATNTYILLPYEMNFEEGALDELLTGEAAW